MACCASKQVYCLLVSPTLLYGLQKQKWRAERFPLWLTDFTTKFKKKRELVVNSGREIILQFLGGKVVANCDTFLRMCHYANICWFFWWCQAKLVGFPRLEGCFNFGSRDKVEDTHTKMLPHSLLSLKFRKLLTWRWISEHREVTVPWEFPIHHAVFYLGGSGSIIEASGETSDLARMRQGKHHCAGVQASDGAGGTLETSSSNPFWPGAGILADCIWNRHQYLMDSETSLDWEPVWKDCE